MSQLPYYCEPEPVYAALFDLLFRIPDFNVKSRILRHWDDVRPEEQPALFVTVPYNAMRVEGAARSVPKVTLFANLLFYCRTVEPKEPPSVLLNKLVGAVMKVMTPSPSQGDARLVLYDADGAPLVKNVRINGNVETAESVGTGEGPIQSVGLIPVEILVNH